MARRTARLPIIGQPPAASAAERSDAARNRAAILAAARKLIKKRPIGEICMDELARTAGVGKGTLYRRFADRSSLCRALLDEESMRLQARTLHEFDLPPGAPPLQRLRTFLDALFEFVTENTLLLSEALAFERGTIGRFDHPAYVWQRKTIALYLRKAAESGELTVTEPEVAADLILATLDPDLIGWHLARGTTKAQLHSSLRKLWGSGLLERDGDGR
jgi:AcrR family transcriptional regulator